MSISAEHREYVELLLQNFLFLCPTIEPQVHELQREDFNIAWGKENIQLRLEVLCKLRKVIFGNLISAAKEFITGVTILEETLSCKQIRDNITLYGIGLVIMDEISNAVILSPAETQVSREVVLSLCNVGELLSVAPQLLGDDHKLMKFIEVFG